MFDLLMQCSSVGTVMLIVTLVGDAYNLNINNREKLLLQWIKLRAMCDLLKQCSSVGNVEVMDGEVDLGYLFCFLKMLEE